jgi:hypothetical protein
MKNYSTEDEIWFFEIQVDGKNGIYKDAHYYESREEGIDDMISKLDNLKHK